MFGITDRCGSSHGHRKRSRPGSAATVLVLHRHRSATTSVSQATPRTAIATRFSPDVHGDNPDSSAGNGQRRRVVWSAQV
jgi:hypothetical protein